uniref:Uncharacterized protein n=1 Tax=Oryza nivara TaxID=4536 RepID=A0A0E0ITK5_ORYNI
MTCQMEVNDSPALHQGTPADAVAASPLTTTAEAEDHRSTSRTNEASNTRLADLLCSCCRPSPLPTSPIYSADAVSSIRNLTYEA